MSEVLPASETRSFFDLYCLGLVSQGDIDSWVARWHAGDDPRALGQDLWDYLGLSLSEYQAWAYDPDALPLIQEARRTEQPLDRLVHDRLMARERLEPVVARGLDAWRQLQSGR